MRRPVAHLHIKRLASNIATLDVVSHDLREHRLLVKLESARDLIESVRLEMVNMYGLPDSAPAGWSVVEAAQVEAEQHRK